MPKVSRVALALALLGLLLGRPPPARAVSCQLVLGFGVLHDLIPAVVGDCLENERHGANGDGLQQTTNGLLAWRKLDNWTAFTDGALTWINGPQGVQTRKNAARFAWEGDYARFQALVGAIAGLGPVERAELAQVGKPGFAAGSTWASWLVGDPQLTPDPGNAPGVRAARTDLVARGLVVAPAPADASPTGSPILAPDVADALAAAGASAPAPTAPAIPTPAPTPPAACAAPPDPVLGPILAANPTVATRLGCAASAGASVPLAWEPFQGGAMLWRGDTPTIYALLGGGSWSSWPDTYAGEVLPVVVAPPGLFAPDRGFGTVWQQQGIVRGSLGFATQVEHGMAGGVQAFSGGLAVWTIFDNFVGSPSRSAYALYADGTWWAATYGGVDHP